MEPSSQSIDKAVSTEDLCPITRNINLEVARLEAMMNTLVENKVEAIKADITKSSSNHSTPKIAEKHHQRIISSSTASSSHKDNIRSYKTSYYKKKSLQGRQERSRRARYKYRGHSRQRISSNSPENANFRYSMHRSRKMRALQCCEHATAQFTDDDLEAFDFLTYPDPAYYPACEPESVTCSCPDSRNGQTKIPFEDDYVSINIEDFETLDENAIITQDAFRTGRRKRRKRRKKRRKKLLQQEQLALAATEKIKIIDPEDLPRRARWTIAATACLLLLMCLILVGVTLRMAPIIDDMGK